MQSIPIRAINKIFKYNPKLKYYLKRPFINQNKNKISINQLKSKKNIILFWATDAWFERHLHIQTVIAKILQEQNSNVVLIRCSENLLRCPVIQCNKIETNDKIAIKNLCQDCTSISINKINYYNLDVLLLDDLVSESQKNLIIKNINSGSKISKYIIDDIDFRQVMAGEIIRMHKKSSLEFDDTEQQLLKDNLYSALVNYIAFKYLIQNLDIKSLVYCNDYGLVQPIAKLALNNNINVFNLALASISNLSYNNVVFMSAFGTNDYFNRLEQWPNIKNIALSAEQINQVKNDIFYRFLSDGQTIYSPKLTCDYEKIKKNLKINPNKKTLVAFTSSLDEILSTKTQYAGLGLNTFDNKTSPFENQIDWLEQLIDFTIENNLQLIIRIHPREGEHPGSEHYEQLKNKFTNIKHQDIKIIWSESELSSYDLGGVADLILTAWTSMSVEFGRLGMPVVAAFSDNPMPLVDFINYANNKNDYFDLVTELLNNYQPKLDNIKYAFRWFYLQRQAKSIYIKNLEKKYTDINDIPTKVKQKINSIITNQEDILDKYIKDNSNNSYDQEKKIILQCIKELIILFVAGEKNYYEYLNLSSKNMLDKIEIQANDNQLNININDNLYINNNRNIINLGRLYLGENSA